MSDIVAAFVDAYAGHVAARCAAIGVSPPHEAVQDGEAWLRQTLHDLVATPFEQQRRGPLELFQEAMRFPTEALAGQGVAPVRRDHVTETALPGDIYDLAPASSEELGEEAWHAHLRWGAAKALALAGESED